MSNTPSSNYVPGVCNINLDEIKYRRNVANISLAITLVLLAALVLLGLNRWVRLMLFLPALIAATNYLQVKNKFCVSYGGSGLQHADDEPSAVKVAADAAAKDKARSRQMIRQAIAIAVVFTLLMLLIPVLD